MLARSLVTIEGTLKALDPATNIMEIVSMYKQKLLNVDWNHELKATLLKLVDSANKTVDLPISLDALLKAAQKGQIKVNLNLLGSEQPLANFDRMINRIIICVLIAALLLGSSVICTTNMKPKLFDIPLIGFVGFMIAFGMSLWLFFKMLFLHQKNKPF